MEAFESKLHTSARRGIITLLNKLGWDPLQLKNRRPLSLLDVDYKIISKVISDRIQDTLSYIIGEDQFLKNRYIGENLLDVLSVIEHCSNNDIDAL